MKYASVVSMSGTALLTIVPPFVTAAFDGNAYPLFFFFALYLFLASVLNVNMLPRDYED